MSVDYALIGERIKSKRKAVRKTQEQLAEMLSVTVGYISQIERGVTKVNLDMLSRICDVLDCDMAYFVTGTATGEKVYLQEELIAKYDQLTEAQKRLVLDFLDLLKKHREK